MLLALTACRHPSAPSDDTHGDSGATPESVELSPEQLKSVVIGAADVHAFTQTQETVGNIDFDEDRTVQVSPPYMGRIVRVLARQGDRVRAGQVLFTIDSPDLVQAESTLISAAGAATLTAQVLARARELLGQQGIPQKEYEQAVSDQQAAEAAYRAAQDAVRIFGLGETRRARIIAERHIDAQMPVASPIAGVLVARNAAPGTLVQPGASPAPFVVADLTHKWLLAQVPEDAMAGLHLAQSVDVTVPAYPGRTFHGEIQNIAESVDPNSRRVTLRATVADPDDALKAQMFATFTVHVGETSVLAVPAEAVVREGDGSFSVWTTQDDRRFIRKSVQLGHAQAGLDEISSGLTAGERIATTGALYLSNAALQGGAD